MLTNTSIQNEPSFGSKSQIIDEKVTIFNKFHNESSDFLCPLLEDYDGFESFVDNGNKKSLATKTNKKYQITIIPGKTLDGDKKLPGYKLEYGVFWALRCLAKSEGFVENDQFVVNFTLTSISKILKNSLSKSYIKKALSVLSTAKFQVNNRQEGIREYRYLKNITMPTRIKSGIAVFDDAFIKAIESGNYRQINVSKLLNHTTAGGRFMYQRMCLNFTGAEKDTKNYNRRYDKLISEIHRNDEQKTYKFRYLKTIAKDLKKNGSITLSDEEIRKNFSVKKTKENGQMLYFPVSSDLIAEIKHSNRVAKCIREKHSYIDIHGSLEGFQYSWIKDKPKKTYKKPQQQKEPYISDISMNHVKTSMADTAVPDYINETLNSMSYDIEECKKIDRATEITTSNQLECLLTVSDDRFSMKKNWQPSIELKNAFSGLVDNFEAVKTHFIFHNISKNKLRTAEEWDSDCAGWMNKHLAIVQLSAQTNQRTRSIEEEINDTDW